MRIEARLSRFCEQGETKSPIVGTETVSFDSHYSHNKFVKKIADWYNIGIRKLNNQSYEKSNYVHNTDMPLLQ